LLFFLTQHSSSFYSFPAIFSAVSISATAARLLLHFEVFAARRFFLFASRRALLSLLRYPTTIAPLYVRAMRGVWLPINLNIAGQQAEEEEYAVRRGRSKEEEMVDGHVQNVSARAAAREVK